METEIIKGNQSEMKNTLSEMRNILNGINKGINKVNKAEDQMTYIQDGKAKDTQSEWHKKRFLKNHKNGNGNYKREPVRNEEYII